MDAIVRNFLIESQKNLDKLDQELVRLEAGPSANELLTNMTRAVHTIKGACGFLGFPHLERVTRAGEGLLTRLRDGQLPRTAEISSSVLAMAGAVRRMLREIEGTGHDGESDYPELLAELNRLAAEDSLKSR